MATATAKKKPARTNGNGKPPPAAKTVAPRTRTVPLKHVVSDPARNPRGPVNQDDEAFHELVRSIARHGILQPILVAAENSMAGSWRVIAGHRRTVAARAAGLVEVPVLVAPSDLEGGELAAAITENVIRQDLSPLAEAKAIARLQEEQGLRQVDAAKTLGKSERWVRERLRLLKLPDQVAAALDRGDVPLEATPQLEKVAKVAPELAEALVNAVVNPTTDFEVDRSDLANDQRLGEAIVDVAEAAELDIARFDSVGYRDLDSLPLTEEVRAELEPRVAKLARGQAYGSVLRFGDSDREAARKAGSLLELPGRWPGQTVALTADRELIGERTRLAVERAEQDARERAEKEKRLRSSAAPSSDDKAAAKAERERELAERAEARRVNLELGEATADAFARVDLSAGASGVDVARLLCTWLLEESGIGSVAMRGLRYVDERWQTVSEGRDGQKVEYAKATDLEGDIAAMLAQAESAEELVGLTLRTLVCAHLADQRAVSQSKRAWFNRPGEYENSGPAAEIGNLIERIALDAGVVPDALVDEIADRRRARDAAQAEHQTALASEGRGLELRVLAELTLDWEQHTHGDGDGLTRKRLEDLCSTQRRDQLRLYETAPNGPLWIKPGMLEQALDILEVSGQIDGDARQTEVAYFVTEAGQARLVDPEQDPADALEETAV